MPDLKISELDTLTPVDDADYVAVVDVSAGVTKKATRAEFKGDQGDPGDDGRSFLWEGPWLTATAYAVDDVVSQGGSSYICIVAHTSGTFATDLAASKWQLVAQKGDTGATGATGAAGANGTNGTNGTNGSNGADGDNAYVYIAYASDASGTGFTLTFDANLNYIAILATDTEIPSPDASDFAGLWKNYKGAQGDQGPQGDPGASGTPGGSDTHVQFNDGGVLGGVADFIWNKVTKLLTILGNLRLASTSTYPLTVEGTNTGGNGAFIKTYHNSATPAANDNIGGWDMFANNSTAAETYFGNINVKATNVTAGIEASKFIFSVLAAGAVEDAVDLTAFAFSPGSNDHTALGSTALKWSDLFLASGAVINFNNGDVTITHAPDKITLAGGDLEVPDEAYGAGWNGSVEVPTKNAVYDKIETLATPAFTPVTRITSLFETAGRFTANHTSGTGTFGTNGLVLDTTATTNRTAQILLLTPGSASSSDFFAGSPVFGASFQLGTIGTTGFAYLVIGETSGEDSIERHIGFKIKVVAGVASLYGSQANGTTESNTAALTTIAATDWIAVCCKVNGSSSVDYYYSKNGGAWSAPTNLATNVPTGQTASDALASWTLKNTSSTQFVLRIASFNYER